MLSLKAYAWLIILVFLLMLIRHYIFTRIQPIQKELNFDNIVKDLIRNTQETLQHEQQRGSGNIEKRHVIYVRIPKTGSSTMTFMMWRFGLGRNLTFLLPKKGGEGNEHSLTERRFHLPKNGQYCDLMANHVLYNHTNFQKFFPPDSLYISLLREPMSQLVSTLRVLKRELKMNISTNENIVSHFLRSPESYGRTSSATSFTRNPAMYYFGLHKSEFGDLPRVNKIIQDIDKRFALVLILEKFDESLILLKRIFGWAMRDIIYLKTNVNPLAYKNSQVSDRDKDRLKAWSMADHLLYDFFSKKLNSLIKQQDRSFDKEVQIFNQYLSKANQFCRTWMTGHEISVLKFELSPFNSEFFFTSIDCHLWRMRGLQFLDRIRNHQNRLAPNCNRQYDLIKS